MGEYEHDTVGAQWHNQCHREGDMARNVSERPWNIWNLSRYSNDKEAKEEH